MSHSSSPKLVFTPHFLKIVVGVKALGPPHVLRLWLGVSKGMFPIKFFTPTNPLFASVEFFYDHETVTALRGISPPSAFWGYWQLWRLSLKLIFCFMGFLLSITYLDLQHCISYGIMLSDNDCIDEGSSSLLHCCDL